MELTSIQQLQVIKQLDSHRHLGYEIDIELAPGATLDGFVVDHGVYMPEVTVGIYLARWLYYNNGL